MTNYFDELIQMWERTTDEHVEWQKKAKTMTFDKLLEYAQKLIKEEDEFEEKTKHMRDENPSNHAPILAAKFKNRYAVNRFLASVLMEFSHRLVKMLVEETKPSTKKTSVKPTKFVLSKEMKKAIADQVKLEISKLKDSNFTILKQK